MTWIIIGSPFCLCRFYMGIKVIILETTIIPKKYTITNKYLLVNEKLPPASTPSGQPRFPEPFRHKGLPEKRAQHDRSEDHDAPHAPESRLPAALNHEPWNALRNQYATMFAGISETTPPLTAAARLAAERSEAGIAIFEAALALARARGLTPASEETTFLINKAKDIHAGLTGGDLCEAWVDPAASIAAVKRESQLYFRAGEIPGRAGREVALARAAITYVNSDLRRPDLDHRILGILYHERTEQPVCDAAQMTAAFKACRGAGRQLIASGGGHDVLELALQEAENAGAVFSQAFQMIRHART